MVKDLNYQQEDDEKLSRLNAAGIINITIENLFKEGYSAMLKGDFIGWNSRLDAIWCILGGDEKEGGDADIYMNKLNLMIYDTGNLKQNVSNIGFQVQINPKRSLQYQLLLRKSLFLRRLQNKQGKGTAYQSDEFEDFD